MITTKQITVREILCDDCGKPVQFSGQYCIVCGKHFCQLCDKMIFLDFDGPKYLMLTHFAPDVPRCRACPTCKSEITRGIKALKERVRMWESDRAHHAEQYHRLASKISKLIAKREAEIDVM
jgi:hypothetical protein